MKKNLILLLGGMLLTSACIFIYSCAKKLDDGVAGTTIVPNDLLKAAQNWHAQQTQSASTLSLSNNKKTYVLPPIWKDARLKKLDNGETKIIVPSPDANLDPRFGRGLLRKFVFTTEDGQITDGKIIEMYSSKDSIENRKDNLIENFVNGDAGDFTGLAISYNVNYKRQSGSVYKNGIKDAKLQAAITSMTVADFNKRFPNNKKVAKAGLSTFDTCYVLLGYWYLYDSYGYFQIVGYDVQSYECANNNEGGGPTPDPPPCGMSENKTFAGTCYMPPPPKNPCDEKNQLNNQFASQAISSARSTIFNNTIHTIVNGHLVEFGSNIQMSDWKNTQSPTFVATTVSTINSPDSWPPSFTWEPGHYTISWIHSHPIDAAPSLEDMMEMIEQIENYQLLADNEGAIAAVDFYKANTSMTAIMQTGAAYTVKISDWDHAQSLLTNWKNNHDNMYTNYYSGLAQVISDHPELSELQCGILQIMSYFGGSTSDGVSVFKTALNSNTPQVVTGFDSNAQPIYKNCPN